MSEAEKDPVALLKKAFDSLRPEEKLTKLAKGQTVEQVYGFIQKGERKKAAQFVFNRFYIRYLMLFEKAHLDFNSGFAQMAACCLMIEAMESFRNGWNDTMKDAKKDDGSRKFGGEIFEEFFGRYDEFKDFRGLGREFYSSIRCGILHQAEPQNGWRILREGNLYNNENRSINSTIFRRRMKKCLRNYCEELEATKDDSELWINFKDKMAFIIQNSHKGKMKEPAKS